jgi:hypothetical protein
VASSGRLAAQAPGGQDEDEAPPTAQASAPIDLTGNWVSIVTEDWRWRMVTPAKGDYASVPITEAAKKIADQWDPAVDEAAGEQCKSYGAAGLMRVPTRLRISWQDENTLKIETDAGTQTRLLHFGDWQSPGGEPTWQGDSKATWTMPSRPGGSFGAGVNDAEGGGGPVAANRGSLDVVTTRMRSGYLRKNGLPYSPDATLTEYWDILRQRDGTEWLVITTLIDDPTNLSRPWITSPNFRREPDGSKWDPTPCSARW